MDEFASAVLVAAVARALADAGLATDAPRADGALLPFGEKRRYLAGVAERHGLLPLLRVGLLLPEAVRDPAVTALLAALDPLELLERWGRLEQFTHARHRVLVHGAADGCVTAEHAGPPGEPPVPAEDVLVLGLLTVLLTLTGARGLTVTAGGEAGPTVFDSGVFTAPPPGTDTARWRFTWSATAARAAPVPCTAPAPRALPGSGSGPGPGPGPGTVARARLLLAGDPARRWSLRGLAAGLHTSPRTLQRRLRPAGGFQDLLGAVRAEGAAALLLDGRHPLPVVGFACGYADQPHFTREFARRTAMTPAAYRRAFARHGPSRERTP
ncbi:helix-turn-helix transcriptional regulator [Streptomyces sp. NPDC090077]|uniref:helix-turn-helix transcriptional regulator n=1 Tax=Streptomyces sp. NPDC090077 TaxID=3365938 RepID=UPI0038180099